MSTGRNKLVAINIAHNCVENDDSTPGHARLASSNTFRQRAKEMQIRNTCQESAKLLISQSRRANTPTLQTITKIRGEQQSLFVWFYV